MKLTFRYLVFCYPTMWFGPYCMLSNKTPNYRNKPKCSPSSDSASTHSFSIDDSTTLLNTITQKDTTTTRIETLHPITTAQIKNTSTPFTFTNNMLSTNETTNPSSSIRHTNHNQNILARTTNLKETTPIQEQSSTPNYSPKPNPPIVHNEYHTTYNDKEWTILVIGASSLLAVVVMFVVIAIVFAIVQTFRRRSSHSKTLAKARRRAVDQSWLGETKLPYINHI